MITLLVAAAIACPAPFGLEAFALCGVPADTHAAGAWLAAAGPATPLPADLVAAAGARVIDGRRVGDEALLVVETRGDGDCALPRGAVAGLRRVDGAWRRVGERAIAAFVPIRCLVPGAAVSPTCEVAWDGGIVVDIHVWPTCRPGATPLALGGRPRCVDVATCRVLDPP